MSCGHTNAAYYPIGVALSEARLARRRVNTKTATDAIMMEAVIVRVLTGKGPLEQMLKGLIDVG